MGEGILKVVDMLGLTIRDLQMQLEQAQRVIESQREQIEKLAPARKTG